MGVAGHHGVELHHPEAVGLRLRQAVRDQLFPDVQSPRFAVHGVAGVSDVPAAADVVRVQDVQAQHGAGVGILGHGIVGLGGEKRPAGVQRQRVLLREGHAVFHHLVPDLHHGGQVFFGIGADHDLHAAKSPILLVNLPISAVLILAHRTEKGKISAFSAPGNGGVENCAFPRIFHRRGLQPPRC